MELIAALTYVLCAIETNAQEDFQNRPWKVAVDGSEPTIVITEEGVLVEPLPQYIFTEKSARQVKFQLIDPKTGKAPVGLAAAAGADWRTGLAGRVDGSDKEVNELFRMAGWDIADYSAMLKDGNGTTVPDFAAAPRGLLSYTGELSRSAAQLEYAYSKDRPKDSEWKVAGSFNDKGEATLPLTQDGPFRFSIVRKSEVGAQHVQRWVVALGDEHRSTIAAQSTDIIELKKDIEQLLRDLRDRTTEDCAAKMKRWDKLKNRFAALIDRHDALTARWQIQWMWFTNGRVGIDPFGIKGKELPPDTTGYSAEMAGQHELLHLLEKQMECCGIDGPDVLRSFIQERDAVKERISTHGSFKDRLKTYADWLELNKEALAMAITPDQRLYDGLLYSSTTDTARFMRHFDAISSFGPMNRTRRTEYYDFEERHFIVHNYTGNPKELSLEQAGVKTDHAPSIAELLNPPLAGLAALGASTRTAAGALNPWFASLPQTNAVLLSDSSKCDIIAIEEKQVTADLERMMQRLDTMTTILSIRPATASPYAFSHELGPKGDVAPGQHVSYALITKGSKDEKETTVATGSYDLWKLQRFQLFGGMALSLSDVQRTTVIESNGTIDIKRENERLGFLVGFKYHPWGAEIDDDRFLFHQRRVSLLAAVGLPAPLNDLYAGVGYDVYPGVQVGALLHWYKNEVASIQNNKVVERRNVYSAPVPAVMLTIDSSLFTNLLKLVAP